MTLLLMETGKVDVNLESSEETGRVTALQEAANNGHNVSDRFFFVYKLGKGSCFAVIRRSEFKSKEFERTHSTNASGDDGTCSSSKLACRVDRGQV